jgi:Restriction endonuclease AspBHI N-terminal
MKVESRAIPEMIRSTTWWAEGIRAHFRYVGSPRERTLKLCVLYSELADPDWPDELRVETGVFIYYGDNKRPGTNCMAHSEAEI